MISIGMIHTPHKTKEACPIQPIYAGESVGQVEVFQDYAEGLQDIESFSHIFLLYQLHKGQAIQWVRPTFLDDRPHGIFASRHPCRPNRIGLSIVKLLRKEGHILFVEGADMLDQTPLLDIKPYLPQYDAFPDAREGWTKNLPWRSKPENRE